MGIKKGTKLRMTPAKWAANRANALKQAKPDTILQKVAGMRPRGAKNKKTLILEAAKKQFDEAVASKALELLALQLSLAKREDHDSPSAANDAINSLLDRAFGRASQRVEQTGPGVQTAIKIVHVYAPDSVPPEPFAVGKKVLP